MNGKPKRFLSLQILSQHILKNQKKKKNKKERLFKCKLYSKYLCMYCMYVCVSLCVCISYVCLTVHVFHDSRFTTKVYLENFLDAMHTIKRISNCKNILMSSI